MSIVEQHIDLANELYRLYSDKIISLPDMTNITKIFIINLKEEKAITNEIVMDHQLAEKVNILFHLFNDDLFYCDHLQHGYQRNEDCIFCQQTVDVNADNWKHITLTLRAIYHSLLWCECGDCDEYIQTHIIDGIYDQTDGSLNLERTEAILKDEENEDVETRGFWDQSFDFYYVWSYDYQYREHMSPQGEFLQNHEALLDPHNKIPSQYSG